MKNIFGLGKLANLIKQFSGQQPERPQLSPLGEQLKAYLETNAQQIFSNLENNQTLDSQASGLMNLLKVPLLNILTSFDETTIKNIVKFTCRISDDLRAIIRDFQVRSEFVEGAAVEVKELPEATETDANN